MAAAGEDRISSYIDLQAVSKETTAFKSQLQAVYDFYQKLSATKVTLGKDASFSAIISGLTDATNNLNKYEQAAAKAATTQATQARQTEQTTKAVKDNTSAVQQNEKIKQEQVRTEQEVVKLIREEEKAEQEQIKTKKLKLSYEQAVAREKQKGASQNQAEQRIATQLTNEYYQLGQALKDAEIRYKNLYIVAGKDNPATKAALNEALATRKIIDDIDHSLGNFQRNVGNYASGFNGLNNSVQQILRETPSAVNSLNTFFLAISNNLPYLFDEVQKANSQMAELKKASEAANAALATQAAIQQEAANAATASSTALNTQVDALLATDGAATANIAIVKEQLEEQIALGIAEGKTAEAIALQAEQLLIHSGLSEADAAALKLQVQENIALRTASISATTALEAQAVATAEVNVAAAAQPSTFKRILSSLFSLQSGLTLGVLLLTAFGSKLFAAVGSMIDFSKAAEDVKDNIEETKEAVEDLNEAFKDNGVKQVTEDIEKMKVAVDSAKKGFVDKKEVVKQYNETLGDVLGTAKDFNDVEDVMSDEARLNAYIKAMLYRAAANLALQKAAEAALKAEEDRRKKSQEFASIGTNAAGITSNVTAPGFVPGLNTLDQQIAARINAAKKAQDEAVKLNEDAQQKQEDIAKSFYSDIEKLATQFNLNFNPLGDGKKAGDKVKKTIDVAYEVAKNELERQIKELQDFVDNGSPVLFNQRYAAADELAKKEEQLSTLTLDHEIKNGRAKVLAEQENSFRIIDINKKLSDNLVKITKDRYSKEADIPAPAIDDSVQKQIEAHKKVNDQLNKIIKEAGEDRINTIARLQAEENIRVDEEYAKGLISITEYEQKKKDIAIRYSKELLEAQIQTAEALQSTLDPASDAYNQLATQIAKAKQAISELGVSAKTEGLDKLKETLQNITELVNDFGSAISDIGTIGIDQQNAALEQQLSLLEDKKNKEIEVAEQTIYNEDAKAKAIAEINARAEARENAINARKRVLQERQARFEKAANIANIISTTSLAVVTTLADKTIVPGYLRIPLAVAVGLMGVAQLAKAIATPLPTYRYGTKDHIGGPAIVGDGGKKEVIEFPTGETFTTPDKSTLVNLPRHSKVYPDVDQFLRNRVSMTKVPQYESTKVDSFAYMQQMTNTIDKRLGKLETVIKNKRELHAHLTPFGWMMQMKDSNNQIDYLNDNLHF